MKTLLTMSLLGLAASASAHAQAVPPAASATGPATQVQVFAPPAMRAAAPGMAAYTDQLLFGEVWKRPGLSPRDRSMVVVSSLVAGGRAAQLTGHANRALDNGVTPAEISGLLTHLAFYAGWPPTVSAVSVVDEVFKARGIDRATLGAMGARLPEAASDQARVAAVDRSVRPGSPALAELTNRVVFGDLWRRDDLSPRDRSLVTLAALVTTTDMDELPFYLKRGIEDGLTREQLGEAINQLGFYAGWPRATKAATVLAGLDVPATGDIVVVRAGTGPRIGPAANFTGTVTVDTAFAGTGAATVSGARVTFAPGARTAWHTHPLGQTLFITAGHALIGREGVPVQEAGPGDVVFIPPGVRHWHGAVATETMTHLAITERQDGVSVTWLEKVTDAQYEGKGP